MDLQARITARNRETEQILDKDLHSARPDTHRNMVQKMKTLKRRMTMKKSQRFALL